MALPQRDQRRLEQLERALRASDPRFASRMRRRSARLDRDAVHHRRARRGITTGIITGGFGLLVIGAITSFALFAAMGAVALMVGCFRAM